MSGIELTLMKKERSLSGPGYTSPNDNTVLQEPDGPSTPTPSAHSSEPPCYDNLAFKKPDDEAPLSNELYGIEPRPRSRSYLSQVRRKRTATLEAEEAQDEDSECHQCLNRNGHLVKIILYTFLIVAYFSYFGWCMSIIDLQKEDDVRLLWVTVVVTSLCIFSVIRRKWGDAIYRAICQPIIKFILSKWMFFKWGFIIVVVISIIVFIVMEVAMKEPRNLISLIGYGGLVLLFYIFSAHRKQVKWQTVLWGLGMQFAMALLVLRTSFGLTAFEWLGDRVAEFMDHVTAGASFVFGDLEPHQFAFKVLPTIIFFSSVVSMLYYLGAMQVVIEKIAWVMMIAMETTTAESVNAAGNIFVGQNEAPLLIRPYLPTMTRSELHAVMTGGFATIAGSVLAAYIMFGVPANHLITASVMAAPCALGLSKLSCPEVEVSAEKIENDEELNEPDKTAPEDSGITNIVDAASQGASSTVVIVGSIAANLIAFLSILAFVNATLGWLGARAGLQPPDYPELSFELICSYVFWPMAYLMGVDDGDCRKVAELLGVKIFINEFVAFSELGTLVNNTEIYNEYVATNGSWTQIGDDIFLDDANKTLEGGIIGDRASVISTYACCGFANVGSIGIIIGSLGAIAPNQKPIVATTVVRAMLTGTVVSFLNGCIAGLLYQPEG